MGVFPISGFLVKSLINKICNNSRNSHDIDINLYQKLKLAREIRQRQKNDDDVLPVNYDVIAIFPIVGWFWAIGRMVYNSYILLIVTFYLTKTGNRTKKSLAELWYYFLSKGTIVAKKCWFFAKNVDMSKIKRLLVLKGIFSETIYLCLPKYQISSF